MKRSISSFGLLLAVACSSPSEPGGKPSWADNTSWKGSVTMKSGTTLNISFELTTSLYTDLVSQHEVWGVSVEHARIENASTGRVAESPGSAQGVLPVTWSVRADLALEFTVLPNSAFDPSIPSCPTNVQPDNPPFYRANLQIAGDGTLKGTMDLGCFVPGNPSESQPIVVRRI